MDHRRPRADELLEADLFPVVIAKAEGRRHRAGPQRPVREGCRLQSHPHVLVGVQFRWGRQTWLDLGHIRLHGFTTRLLEDTQSTAGAVGADGDRAYAKGFEVDT